MDEVPSVQVTGKPGTGYYGYIGSAWLFDPATDGTLHEWSLRLFLGYFMHVEPDRPTKPTWFVRLPAEPISWWGTEEELRTVFNLHPNHQPALG